MANKCGGTNKSVKNKCGGKRKIPKKYTRGLSKRDSAKQSKYIRTARKSYKKGKYVDRPKLKSYKKKESGWTAKFHKRYPNAKTVPQIARATGIPAKALNAVKRKGMGAYYSSGSRPNQTGHSWGYARLASSITGGKAAAVDFKILEKKIYKLFFTEMIFMMLMINL